MSKSDTLSVRDILHIFFKNKWITILILVFSMLCSLSYCILTTKLYKAESDILIMMGRDKFSAMNSMTGINYNVVFQERTQNINNELGILTGEPLFKQVFPKIKALIEKSSDIEKENILSRFTFFFKSVSENAKELIRFPLYRLGITKKLTGDEVLALNLQDSFHAEYLEDTDIIRLTFSWSNPIFAAQVLNIYTNEYLLYHTKVHSTKATLELYLNQRDIYKQNLEKIESQLQNLFKENNISNIEEQKRVLLVDISELEKDYYDISTRLTETEIKLHEINRMINSKEEWVETPSIGQIGSKITDLAKLDQIYFDLKAQKEKLRIDFTDKAKEVVDINQQIAQVKKQKGESLSNLLKIEVNSLTTKKMEIEKYLTEKKKQIAKVSYQRIQSEQLERARSIARDKYLLYSKKASDLSISNELDNSHILSLKIVNPALPPLIPYHPRKGRILALTAFLALFFSFGFAIIREYLNHGFQGSKDVEESLDLPLLATVPDLKELRHMSLSND